MANYAVATIIVLSIILIGLLLIRPSITAAQGGKIVAFIAFFILPIVATVLGASIHLENSKSTQFCLSCHVMEAHGKSLYIDDPTYVPAAHFQNNRIPKEQACFTCHTNYTMFGDVHSKMRGLKHIYVYYLKRHRRNSRFMNLSKTVNAYTATPTRDPSKKPRRTRR